MAEYLEWKDITIDKPEVGKRYITLDSDGKYAVRPYERLHLGNLSRGGSQRAIVDPDGEAEGFVGGGNTLQTKVAFYMELPEEPERISRVRNIRNEIARLNAELESLEGEHA